MQKVAKILSLTQFSIHRSERNLFLVQARNSGGGGGGGGGVRSAPDNNTSRFMTPSVVMTLRCNIASNHHWFMCMRINVCIVIEFTCTLVFVYIVCIYMYIVCLCLHSVCLRVHHVCFC